MHKQRKTQLGLYYALKEWFDPAMEGNPYDSGQVVKRVSLKQVRPFVHRAWMTV